MIASARTFAVCGVLALVVAVALLFVPRDGVFKFSEGWDPFECGSVARPAELVGNPDFPFATFARAECSSDLRDQKLMAGGAALVGLVLLGSSAETYRRHGDELPMHA